jgi:hypothetical protein
MLPAFLESTYRRYKNDTSVFVKWLYETGSKCGYVVSTAKDETPVKAARLKGKARKKAKEGSTGKSSSTIPGSLNIWVSKRYSLQQILAWSSDADSF